MIPQGIASDEIAAQMGNKSPEAMDELEPEEP